tara:strand:- start:71 stop:985 length:915 start_codon:yes stop_codon:yes gene_type:complete
MSDLDLLLTSNLLNEVFKPRDSITTEYLNWHYQENPAGSACVGYINEQGKQISNYALIPKPLQNHFAEKITLGLGVDLAVSPDSRGKGVFRETIEKSYKAGIDGNLDGILGVANSQSSPRMTDAMGWVKLPSMDLRLLKFSKPFETTTTFQIGSDEFAQNAEKGIFNFENLKPSNGFMPVWDLELLIWRLSKPGSQYFLHLSDSALTISTKATFRGLRTAVLLKAFPIKPKKTTLPMAPFASAIAKHHQTPFVTYWGANEYFEVEGFRVPRKVQPSPLDLVLHFFGKKRDFELSGFELFDFDAF